VFFEVLLYFEGGHAAGAGGGDGLAVAAVLDVSAGEDAGDDFAVLRGEDIVLCENVAVGVEVDHALKGLGIGDVANGEEHEFDGKDALVAGDAVFDAQAGNVLVFGAEDLLDRGAGEEVDLWVSDCALEHDL